MNQSMLYKSRVRLVDLVLLILFVQAGYATAQAAPLPPVMATYRTILNDDTGETAPAWSFLRIGNELEIRHAVIGEHWTLLGDDKSAYSWIHHGEKAVVHYTPADLEMLHAGKGWDAHATLIDPELIAKLEKTGMTTVLGYPAVIYRGTVNGQALEVHWLPDFSLPGIVVQQAGGNVMRIELLSVSTPDGNTAAFTDLDSYFDLDFADIGDNEAHPILRRLLYGGLGVPGIDGHSH